MFAIFVSRDSQISAARRVSPHRFAARACRAHRAVSTVGFHVPIACARSPSTRAVHQHRSWRRRLSQRWTFIIRVAGAPPLDRISSCYMSDISLDCRFPCSQLSASHLSLPMPFPSRRRARPTPATRITCPRVSRRPLPYRCQAPE